MKGKRFLVILAPVVAAFSLIGGAFATWYFTENNQVSRDGQISVDVEDGYKLGKIIVDNADSVYLMLDQTHHSFSEPLRVRFIPDVKTGLVSNDETEEPSPDLFNFTYRLEPSNDEDFTTYFSYDHGELNWEEGDYVYVDGSGSESGHWEYQASINPTFTLIKSMVSVNDFIDVKEKLADQTFTFHLSVTLA